MFALVGIQGKTALTELENSTGHFGECDFPCAPVSSCVPGRLLGTIQGETTMSKNQRQTPRKPATKFAHLRKKMQKQKVQIKQPRKK
jgi:hypothetical protein